MEDTEKTKEQLLEELRDIRKQLELASTDTASGRDGNAISLQPGEIFFKAFHASPDMIIISSIPDSKYVEVNNAFARNVGYSREDLIGRSLQEFNFFAYPSEEERMMELLRKYGGYNGEEFSFRTRYGELQQWLCSAEIVDINGEKRTLATAIDITRRKKMEEALDESRQLIAAAFQSSPQAIGIARLSDGKFIEVNDIQLNFTGYTREELIGRSALELNMWYSTEDNDRIRNMLMEKGRVVNEELMFRNKSGSVTPTLFSALTVKVGGEQCIIAVCTDLTERWKMEQALRESEEKFSKAFTSSPTAICLFSLDDSKFMEINDSFIRFTGYSREEIVGHTPDDLNLWVSHEEMDNMASILRKNGQLMNEIIHSRMKNGDVRAGLFSAQTFDMSGKPHMILSINDVTDQSKAEEAIANEVILRRILIQNSRDGIVIIDSSGKVFEANRKYCEMLGYTPEEIKNLYVWDWDHAIDRRRLQEMIDTVDDTGDHFETQHWRKDGSFYDVEISTNGAIIAGKKLIFCVCRDITERKRIEKALRESEEKFSKAFQSSPVLTAITTLKDGKYIDINENYCSHMGFTRQELIGNSALELGVWVNLKERDDYYRTLKEQGRIINKEYKFRTKSGKVRTWLFSAEMVTINGEPCVLGVSIDITEQKLIEAKAMEAENLREVERLRRELFSNVSHELRTPLAGIKGFTSMLLDYGNRLKAGEKREYLETIDKNADHMVELIEQLLEMSRLGAGMIMIRRKPANINHLSRIAISEVQSRAPSHTFTIDLPKRLPVIEIDGSRIRQVLDHLLDNAVKYSKAGTEISLSVRKTGGELLFVITDHGQGIAKEDIPYIFDRMFISRHKKKPAVSGAGLGLSICKGLIEAHNGRIWVESEEGAGTRCFFTLPVKTTPVEQEKNRALQSRD